MSSPVVVRMWLSQLRAILDQLGLLLTDEHACICFTHRRSLEPRVIRFFAFKPLVHIEDLLSRLNVLVSVLFTQFGKLVDVTGGSVHSGRHLHFQLLFFFV